MFGQVWDDCRGRCPGSASVKVEADQAAGVVVGGIQPNLPGCKPNCKVYLNTFALRRFELSFRYKSSSIAC